MNEIKSNETLFPVESHLHNVKNYVKTEEMRILVYYLKVAELFCVWFVYFIKLKFSKDNIYLICVVVHFQIAASPSHIFFF